MRKKNTILFLLLNVIGILGQTVFGNAGLLLTDTQSIEYSGTVQFENSQFYYNNGTSIKDSFRISKDGLRYYDTNGEMYVGFFTEPETTYTYFFNEQGLAEEGWIYSNGQYFYLEDGVLFAGWNKIGDNWYYFDEQGQLLRNTRTPDGYEVDYLGIWKDTISDDSAENDARISDSFTWNKDTGQVSVPSGLMIAGRPVEFYMLCIAGETGGLANWASVVYGDSGRAYGICQFDYRYTLVDFMNFAYARHPELWSDFEAYLNYASGNGDLRSNTTIGNCFLSAMSTDFETAVTDQLEFMLEMYWNGMEEDMNNAGFHLDTRNIAVSAALFSVTVNCGPQSFAFISNIDPNCSDEEMIRGIYRIRNTLLSRNGKGTSTRFLSAEPTMALDLLYGYVTVDSECTYGGGVSWHGNPFSEETATIALSRVKDTYVNFSNGSADNEEPEKTVSGAIETTAEPPSTETAVITEEVPLLEIETSSLPPA